MTKRLLHTVGGRAAIALVVAAAGSLSFGAAPASAAFAHAFTGTFGSATSTPADPYPLSNPAQVAVDNSSGGSAGDIYAPDPANHRVEKFDPSGNFLFMFGKDVDQTTGGDVCPEHNGDVCQEGTEGSGPGEFESPTFVAVDPTSGPAGGDVYIGDTSDAVVSKFDPSGQLIGSWGSGGQLTGFYGEINGLAVDLVGHLFVLGGEPFWYEQDGTLHSEITDPRGISPAGLAVDVEDHLYQVDGSPEVTKFSTTGEDLADELAPEYSPATGLEIDPTTNDLYVDYEGGVIDRFQFNCGEHCSPTEEFGSGNLNEAQGVGISGSSTIYVANTGDADIARFVAMVIPDVMTKPVSGLGSTIATLNGHVDPAGQGDITECFFEYGTTKSYTDTVPCSQGTPYSAATDVSAEVSELERFTIYHYRVVVKNEHGTYPGADHTFRTPGVPVECIVGEQFGEPLYEPCESFTIQPSTTQAGGHPDITLNYAFGNRDELEFPTDCLCQDPAKIRTSLPTGVIGNPHATPYCSRVDFATSSCSPSTQVGTVLINLFGSHFHEALYNLEPDPDQAGFFGFFAPLAESPIYTEVSARTGTDYGLDLTTVGIEHIIPPREIGYELWGVPADPSHNAARGGHPSDSEPIPFLDNPTTCTGTPLSGSLEIVAYDGGVSNATAVYPSTLGCDQLSFNPSLYAQPTTTATDSPSGLDVDLSVPQTVSPTTPSPSEIRATKMILPEGMSINPNAADGKTVCSDAEARIGSFASEEEAECPEFSKIGSATISSSALPGPISGFAYLGEPKSGERYRLILTANGFATHVKLAGMVEPDPKTGRLTVSFENLPQSPFSDFDLHFFGSERGLLATPTQCGTYPVMSTFTPWDSALPKQSSTQFFTLDSGPGGSPCPGAQRPFSPSLHAGVADSTAGAHTPFSLELTRSDGNQNLSALNVSTPPGFSATLAGIPYCPDAALEAAANPGHSAAEEEVSASCPAGSQIGTAEATAGAGTHPFHAPGKVYLAGPYRGAPLSLAVITPAISGPYDLGNVVIRAAIFVNSETARVTAVSDPLPRILDGIPLRLRSVRINLNRKEFVLNPTNCDPFSVDTEVFGDQGAVARPDEHFQVANCASLRFGPALRLAFSGNTGRTGNPALTATLTASPGESNLASASVTLPHSELLDNAHIQSPCTRVQFGENACPASSVIGFAVAQTPLLEKPLEGPVYLRSSSHKLPDVVAALKGQVDVTLDGRVDSRKGRLRATFEAVPDVPVSSFTLSLLGGQQGLFANSENLCKARQIAVERIVGQNGKTIKRNATVHRKCQGNASKPQVANHKHRHRHSVRKAG
jgi:hypothetical protein